MSRETEAATSPDVKGILRQVQDRLFGAEDTVCLERARLVTEADRFYADEPPSLRRALCFRHILRHMTLDLASNPVFAGNTSTGPRAWMLVPEFALGVPLQVQIENDCLPANWLDGKVPDDILEYWQPRQIGGTPGGPGGIGHMSIDFDGVVNEGLEAVVTRLRERARRGSQEQRIYRRAMALACEAVLEWADRYAEAAAARSEAEQDRTLAACHLRVAAACRYVPRRPARSLFEGLQAILLAHLATVIEGQGISQSIGLSDRVLARFADEAADDPEQAAQFASAFILGVAANSFLGRGSKTQAVTVGGADAEGRDRCNAVTLAFMEGFRRTPVGDPHLFLRWHPGIAGPAWDLALTMLGEGRSMPLLVNDHAVAPGLEDVGVAPRDAWDYCIAGCNEVGIPGRATTTAFALEQGLVDVGVLRRVLMESGAVGSTEDLLDAYELQVERDLEASFPRRDARLRELAERAPFPFVSACCTGPASAGADYLVSMPYSHIAVVFVRGTVNAANALAAIDRVVFGRQLIDTEALLDGLERNDKGVLALLREAPKWCNDDPAADRWAVRLHEARERALGRIAADRCAPVIVCHVIRSLHHVSGRPLGATPDGRPSGEPLADSIGAAGGSGCEGPTAMLNSVLKLDARRFYKGTYNLNLSLSRAQARPDLLRALCETFLQNGGQELQVNVLNAARLKEARAHPGAFGDLVVRVAGLNARFVELSRVEQDEIIRRAEAVG